MESEYLLRVYSMSHLVSGNSSSQCECASLFNILMPGPARYELLLLKMIPFHNSAPLWKNTAIIPPPFSLLTLVVHLIAAAASWFYSICPGCILPRPTTRVCGSCLREGVRTKWMAQCCIHTNLIESQMRNSFHIAMGFSFQSAEKKSRASLYVNWSHWLYKVNFSRK